MSKIILIAKNALMRSPILVYPDPNKPYTLLTNASRYAWFKVLTQEYNTSRDGKVVIHQHPITCVSGLFQGS